MLSTCLCRKYEQALEYHRQALVLIPQNASTYSAIGYVHSLMGDFESAIDYFHTVRKPSYFCGFGQFKNQSSFYSWSQTYELLFLGTWSEKRWHVFGNHAGALYWDVYQRFRCLYWWDNHMFSICTIQFEVHFKWYMVLFFAGTDIKDKVRKTLSTPALIKMLNTSSDGSDSRVQPAEEAIVCQETPSFNAEKQTDAFQRFLLECDMHESDMMLETSMSDTSTWSWPVLCGSQRNFEYAHENMLECDFEEDTTQPSLIPPSPLCWTPVEFFTLNKCKEVNAEGLKERFNQ